jgi:hypothetical protein
MVILSVSFIGVKNEYDYYTPKNLATWQRSASKLSPVATRSRDLKTYDYFG